MISQDTIYKIQLEVNGESRQAEVPAGRTLVDLLRYDLGLTGTKEACSIGVCGLCTVLLNGRMVASCITLAVQADGVRIETIEGMASEDGELHAIQRAFSEKHGLQCGFCTPGMVMLTKAFLAENPNPTDTEIRHALAGNLCRCTGYQNIVRSISFAAESLSTGAAS